MRSSWDIEHIPGTPAHERALIVDNLCYIISSLLSPTLCTFDLHSLPDAE